MYSAAGAHFAFLIYTSMLPCHFPLLLTPSLPSTNLYCSKQSLPAPAHVPSGSGTTEALQTFPLVPLTSGLLPHALFNPACLQQPTLAECSPHQHTDTIRLCHQTVWFRHQIKLAYCTQLATQLMQTVTVVLIYLIWLKHGTSTKMSCTLLLFSGKLCTFHVGWGDALNWIESSDGEDAIFCKLSWHFAIGGEDTSNKTGSWHWKSIEEKCE